MSEPTALSPGSVALALLTVALNSAAQLCLRGAALRGAVPSDPRSLLGSPLFLTALVAYGMSVLTWLAVLKKLPLPVALPFVSLMYVTVPFGARLLFGDALSWRTAGGTALIVAGVIVIAAK